MGFKAKTREAVVFCDAVPYTRVQARSEADTRRKAPRNRKGTCRDRQSRVATSSTRIVRRQRREIRTQRGLSVFLPTSRSASQQLEPERHFILAVRHANSRALTCEVFLRVSFPWCTLCRYSASCSLCLLWNTSTFSGLRRDRVQYSHDLIALPELNMGCSSNLRQQIRYILFDETTKNDRTR